MENVSHIIISSHNPVKAKLQLNSRFSSNIVEELLQEIRQTHLTPTDSNVG